MNKVVAISLHSGLLILLFLSIAECLFLKDTDNSRHKRGFRKGAAGRLAHGYGKRGFPSLSTSSHPVHLRHADSLYDDDEEDVDDVMMPSSRESRQLEEARQQLVDSLRQEEDHSSLILSTQEFGKLLQENEELAQIIVKKFIDVNDDDIISSDELFRRIRE